MAVSLTVNDQAVTIDAADDTPLLWALRDLLGLTGTKFGCGKGLCGACTVHLEGGAVRSCQLPIAAVAGRHVMTIEHLEQSAVGQALLKAWLAVEVSQCGYCQPGQLMSAAALLTSTARPTDEQIDAAMNGNLCRCGTYLRIRSAIHRAAQAPAAGSSGAA